MVSIYTPKLILPQRQKPRMQFQQVPSVLASWGSLSPYTSFCGWDLRIPPAAPVLVKPGGQGQEAAWSCVFPRVTWQGHRQWKGSPGRGEERPHSTGTLTRGFGGELGWVWGGSQSFLPALPGLVLSSLQDTNSSWHLGMFSCRSPSADITVFLVPTQHGVLCAVMWGCLTEPWF